MRVEGLIGLKITWVRNTNPKPCIFMTQATPSFGDKTSLVKTLILISSMTSSYLAHYNAPKFLNEITNGDKLKQ